MMRGDATVQLPPDCEDLENGKEAGLGRILRLAKPEWCWIFFGIIALFLGIVPMLLLPLFFGMVIDDIKADGTNDERRELVAKHLSAMLVILLFGSVANLFRAFIFNAGGERVVSRLRVKLFRAIVHQEIAMFDTRQTGELLSRLTADTTALQDVATANVSMFFRSITQVFFSMTLMFYTSPALALLILAIVPVIVISVVCYARILKGLATQYTDALAVSNNVAQQSVANIRTVRSFAAEDVECKKYETAVGDPDDKNDVKFCWFPKNPSAYKAGVKRQVAGAFFQAFVTLVGTGAIIAVIWFGAYQVIDGNLSEGQLITFILYALQIAMSLGMMAGLVTSLSSAQGASKRTFQLIDREPKVPSKGGETPDFMVGDIRFDDVTFAYPTRPEVTVLKNFTLDIPKNEHVAFVGHSGSGKSTILSLIQRFYDVTTGRILIDGRPLTSLDPSWVRRNFAFVQQEPVLFGSTVAANIGYGHAVKMGDPSAKPEESAIRKAAKDAFADEFLSDKEQFPQGYDTVVGERGVRLSGGQKQRVAIARALLMDPRVLLLDEATSALDAESERYVTDAIEKAMVGRTVLIVAHRLSTVQTADTIVVIDHGVIQATGSHSHLLKTSTKYEELVRRQLNNTETSSAPDPDAPVANHSAFGPGRVLSLAASEVEEPQSATAGSLLSVKMQTMDNRPLLQK